MTNKLTDAERATLNDAMAIILANTPEGSSWLFDARYPTGIRKDTGVTYFTASLHEQHSMLPGETFADKIQAGIDAETAERGDPDSAKAKRIAYLRDQLAGLTGEAA
jgi:hypothetical protein